MLTIILELERLQPHAASVQGGVSSRKMLKDACAQASLKKATCASCLGTCRVASQDLHCSLACLLEIAHLVDDRCCVPGLAWNSEFRE